MKPGSKRLEGAFYGALLFFMFAPVVVYEAAKRGVSAIWPERSGPVRLALCGGSLAPLAGLAVSTAILWPMLGPVWALLVSVGVGAALGAAFGAVVSDLRALPPSGTPGALELLEAERPDLVRPANGEPRGFVFVPPGEPPPSEETISLLTSAMGKIAAAQVDGVIAPPGVEISISLPELDAGRVYNIPGPRIFESAAPHLPRTLPPVLKADEIARPGKCVSCAGMRYVPGGGNRGLVKCERCWHIGPHEGGSPWLPIS